jgi:hypothetical protein
LNDFWPTYSLWFEDTILNSLLLREIKKGETFASLLNIHGGDIHVVPTHLVFAMLWDIDLIFGMWVYNDKLQIKCTFRSGLMIFGRVMALGLKFGQIFSCHHFFSLCLEILTWYLVCECIRMSYRSKLLFVPVQWFFLVELWPLDFEIWPNI